MLRNLILLLAMSLLGLAPVAAQSPAPAPAPAPAQEPRIAPVPAWVRPVERGTPDPAFADRPAQWLLSDSQSRFSADATEHFVHLAFLIQDAQGLQGLGSIVIPWPPQQSELIVHQVRIIRGSTVIDLLANGQRFTVLRRENNLESATLDGILTAVMQPEGLAVGDILELSWTLRRHGGALPLRAENLFAIVATQPVRKLSIRQIWPDSMTVRWRATGAFAPAAVRHTPLGTELSVELADARQPELPAQLPERVQAASRLELSQYRDWAEISAMVAPHYEQAVQLGPDSPVRAEIARIAGASQDPRVRTMAALRLVQDQVRYFALVMGDGNYLPVTADQTWTRRFADCKGKAVLLVALLRGLGIEAEPVLVNSHAGDGLDERIPMLPMFDHMIVRARVGDRVYWLDGTHSGDRDLDDLAGSTLGWGLPIRAAGAALEHMPFASPAHPLSETNIVFDGSAGLADTMPARVEGVFRGELAVRMRAVIAQVGREDFLRQMRQGMGTGPFALTIATVDVHDDPDTGTLTLIATGTAPLRWNPVPGMPPAGGPRRYLFSNDLLRMEDLPDRPEGPFRDAPIALAAPLYVTTSETIVLPRDLQGVSIDGGDFDRVFDGTRFSRHVAISADRVVARSEVRRVAPEVGAAEARASVVQLRQIAADRAYLRVPVSAFHPTAGRRGAGVQAAPARTEVTAAPPAPTTADGFVSRGYERLQRNDLDGAAADFAHATTLSPNWSRPIANSAIVLIHRRRFAEAEPLLSRAAGLNPSDFVIYQGRGMIELARDRPIQAVVAFSRAIDLEPGNAFNLGERARAYLQLGAFDDALTDLAAIVAPDSAVVEALALKARIYAWRGQAEQAASAADALLAADPHSPGLQFERARLLRRIGRAEAAAAGYAQALATVETLTREQPGDAESLAELRRTILADMGDFPHAIAAFDARLAERPDDPNRLNNSCWARATANLELSRALADCDRGVALAPHDPAVLDSRAFVKFRMGQFEAAIADETAVLAIDPQHAAALYIRGLAHLRKGERDAGERDLAAARRLVFDIEATYRDFGVTP